jgi:hypothetical protein
LLEPRVMEDGVELPPDRGVEAGDIHTQPLRE